MIDFGGLFKYLLRNIWLIILLVIISVTITYFLTENLPDSYNSEAQISTGITDLAKIDNSQTSNYMQVRQTYANIMGMMTMKRVLGIVSHILVIHDLKDEHNAFKPYPEGLESLIGNSKKELLAEFEARLATGRVILSNHDKFKNLKLTDVVNMMGYDEASLLQGLYITRYGESDFITVGYVSQDPELSAFVVNTLSTEFIHYYHTFTSANETKSVTLLDSLLKEKERIMQEKNESLKQYRVNSGILDASTQSSAVYQQITILEGQRAGRVTEIQSLQGAISDIKAQLSNPQSEYLTPTASRSNNELVEVERQLQAANRRYIDNNFNSADKLVVDSLQRKRGELMSLSPSRATTSNVQVNRQNLESELIRLETSLSLAKNSISSLESEINRARGKHNAMVPMDAGLQNFQREADIATQEYMEILNRTNQAGFSSNVGLRLSIVEVGLPGVKQSSKRILYVGLSGFATLMLCIAVLSLIFVMDRRVVSKEQLDALTNGKVVGSLNQLGKTHNGIRSMWDDNTNVETVMYKDLLRSLRFDLNKELVINKARVLGVTSLSPGVGKSFLSVSLAYAFAVTGKKVLLIGEKAYDFYGKLESTESKEQEFESFLVKREIQIEDLITTLTRNPHQNSLLELQDMENLMTSFGVLRNEFDIIIIDTDSCQNLNQVKEWLMFSDVSIAVYESGKSISSSEKNLIKYLSNHPGFFGWVLNKVKINA